MYYSNCNSAEYSENTEKTNDKKSQQKMSICEDIIMAIYNDNCLFEYPSISLIHKPLILHSIRDFKITGK